MNGSYFLEQDSGLERIHQLSYRYCEIYALFERVQRVLVSYFEVVVAFELQLFHLAHVYGTLLHPDSGFFLDESHMLRISRECRQSMFCSLCVCGITSICIGLQFVTSLVEFKPRYSSTGFT